MPSSFRDAGAFAPAVAGREDRMRAPDHHAELRGRTQLSHGNNVFFPFTLIRRDRPLKAVA